MQLPATPFAGVGVALVTLFDYDGALDAGGTARHAARLVDEGVRGVVVNGTTGEAAALAPDERLAVLGAVLDAVGGRVPVLAGTGAPSAREAALLSAQAEDVGADAVMVLSPPGTDDPRPYYEAVDKAVELPVLAYHYPNASSPGIPVDLVEDLPVAGIKDSSGEAKRLALEVDARPEGVYTGSEGLLLLANAMGASGAIVGLANLDLSGCVRAWEGDGQCQRELISGHRAGGLGGVRSLKRTLAARYGTSPAARLG